MAKFIFIVGGARSGKSGYARDLAKGISKKVAFIATCIPQDEEMKKRIAQHKRIRPRYWKIIEEGKDVKSALIKLKNRFDVVIIDCLGLLISNFLHHGLNEKLIERKIRAIAQILPKAKFTSIVVSNEVGSGIVPENILARQFRDLTGLSNQIMSEYADTVYIMQAGIPVKIKGARDEQAKRNSGKYRKDRP